MNAVWVSMTEENELKKKSEIIGINKKIFSSLIDVFTGDRPALECDLQKPIELLGEARHLVEDTSDVPESINSLELIENVAHKQVDELPMFLEQRMRSDLDLFLNEVLKRQKKDPDYLRETMYLPLIKDEILLSSLVPRITGVFQNTSIIETHREDLRHLLNLWESYIEPGKTRTPAPQKEIPNEKASISEDVFKLMDDFKKKFASNDEIFILEYILDETYSKTIKKLNLISYLVTLNEFSLSLSKPGEIPRSGKYKIVRTKNQKEKVDNASVILGITQHEWSSLRTKNKDLQNREKLKYLD
jgi:hypothetical protein